MYDIIGTLLVLDDCGLKMNYLRILYNEYDRSLHHITVPYLQYRREMMISAFRCAEKSIGNWMHEPNSNSILSIRQ